eukprot:Seg1276.14 transcript_id=Seg1276.14/GoldUCD/mRNA.D3Y31 product="putative transposon-derived protein F52C9.6" pseudo=true protein_id=Seg1276.14/GoldUCD/D3Y31
MQGMGFPAHLTTLIAKLCKDQESTVRATYGDSEWFNIRRGVRQVCIISPSLYNIYAENITRKTLEGFESGITIGGEKLTNLRFAYNMVVICNSKEELIKLLSDLKRESEEIELLLNAKKTKIMVVDENRETREGYKSDDDELEEVNSFVYLGSTINCKGDSTEEIKRRIGMKRALQ